MRVRTGKSRGFVLTGDNIELLRASTWPGTVWRKAEDAIRMPESVATWKFLQTRKGLEVSIGAKEKLNAIGECYRKARQELRVAERRFKSTGETDIPVPLRSVPYEHQVRAFGFCASLDGAGCFADQGTGKSLIAIAVCGLRYLQGEVTRVLVVTPKNVRQVWPTQLLTHAGYQWVASISKKPPHATDACQFWVMSYDQVKGQMKAIKGWKPDMVIWDESHRLKNRDSKRYKANRDMSQRIRYRLLLSGTPIGKCISEAWSQYVLIDKDVFGSYSSFKGRYLKMGGYMQHEVVGYNNVDEFYQKFHSKTFRVTKDECLDLPPISYQRIYVESSKKASQTYNSFAKELWMETKSGEVTSPGAAVTSMKLRQIAGGIVKTDEGNIAKLNDDKMSAFREFMEDRLSKKTLVFFSFTHEIALAVKVCKKLGIKYMTLEGSTRPAERDTFESRFQSSRQPCVALIQVQTGAEGLTLHSADYALFYSPSFSYIGFAQARDRIHRIGQTQNVTIGFLIVENTVDERVVEVLESNGQLVKTTLETNRKYKLEKSKMSKKDKAATETKTKSTGGYTAKDMAESLGIEPKELRVHLRATKTEKPEAGWVWKNKTEAKDVEKAVAARIKELANKPAKAPKAAEEKPAKAGKSKKSDAPAEEPKGKKGKKVKDEEPAAPKGKAKKKSGKE